MPKTPAQLLNLTKHLDEKRTDEITGKLSENDWAKHNLAEDFYFNAGIKNPEKLNKCVEIFLTRTESDQFYVDWV